MVEIVAARQSTFEIRPDRIVYVPNRNISDKLLSVDEEGRSGIDLEFLCSAIADLLDAVEQFLICEAGTEAIFGKARLPGDRKERRQRLLYRPFLLGPK